MVQLTAGWSFQHHPLGAAFRSKLFLVGTPALQVGHVEHAMGYCSQGENPAGMLSLAVPVDEARPMVHRGHAIGPLEVGVTRSGEGYEVVCRAGVRFVVASVAQTRAESYAADLWHEPGVWAHGADRLQFVDAAHRARYLDACGRILGAVDEQPGLLADRHAAALLEERLLESLFLNAHVPSACAGDRSRYHLARQAYRYLQDRIDEVPSIREVCAVTGASYAKLERGFRETYGLTPKALMAAMRLSGARRHLDVNSFEVSPRVGVRLHFLSRGLPTALRARERPPSRRIVVRDLVRVEFRNLVYTGAGSGSDSTVRFRNRLEFLVPLNKEKVSEDGARYLLADWQLYVPLDDVEERFANKQRIRAGLGYRRSFAWRFEALYMWTRSRNTVEEGFRTSDNIIDIRVKRVF